MLQFMVSGPSVSNPVALASYPLALQSVTLLLIDDAAFDWLREWWIGLGSSLRWHGIRFTYIFVAFIRVDALSWMGLKFDACCRPLASPSH